MSASAAHASRAGRIQSVDEQKWSISGVANASASKASACRSRSASVTNSIAPLIVAKRERPRQRTDAGGTYATPARAGATGA